MRRADADQPAVQVGRQLQVDPVAAVLAGEQLTPVPPVERGCQGAVDQAHLARHQHAQLVRVTAQHRGEQAHHQLLVGPGGADRDAEVLGQILVAGVTPQPAQRQPQAVDQRQHPRPAVPSQSGNASSA